MNTKNKFNFKAMDSNGDEQEVFYYGIDPRKFYQLMNEIPQHDEVVTAEGKRDFIPKKIYGDEYYGWAETFKPRLTELLQDAYYEKNPATITHEQVMEDICIDNGALNNFIYGGKETQGYLFFCREQRLRLVRKS